MTNDREWNTYVFSWQKRNQEKIDKKCEEQENDDCFDIRSCIKSLCRSVGISVPVTVTPFAVPGKPTAKCAGEHEVNPCSKYCDNENNSLKFTITQKLNVNIPVLFGAEICFDKASAVDNGEYNNEGNG